MASTSEQHVTRWIPAYHDGELPERERQRLEGHLATCPACRAELTALQQLSTVLQTATIAAAPATAAFTQAVVARLTSQPRRLTWRRALQWGWQAAPLAVIAGWAAIQAILTVVAGLWLANAGLFPGFSLPTWLLAWLAFWWPFTGAGGELLFQALGSAPGWLSGLTIVVDLLLLNLALTGGCLALLSGWLAGWWSLRQRNALPNTATYG
jgi:predicted anti-sigma-YlaC factor YlaD